jgi:putative SOS response-associated peptidase YedK
MSRFHKPGKEKRSLVVLPPNSYGAWLDAKTDDEARAVFTLFNEAEFDTGPIEPAATQSLF